jgi:site-specific recombinase XerC
MGLIGWPKVDKTLPKSYSADTVGQLLAVLDDDAASRRRSDWVERERALLLTGS